MASNKASVYTQKQAEKVHGKWNKKFSATQREGVKLSVNEAKLLNDNFEVSGRHYELDEKATKAYLDSLKGNK